MELTIEQSLQQGIAAHNSGNLQEAERAYRSILQSQPKHPDANHNLGLIAISANQIEAALPLFKTALDVNPNIEQFWMSYIDALVRNQQLDDAVLAIKEAKNRGLDTKEIRELLSLSKKTADTDGPSQEQLDTLSGFYQTERFADAEKLANSITEKFPTHQYTWNLLGAIFGQTGRYSEALVANQKALALSPKDAQAHYNLGITLKSLGRLAECKSSFTQAVTLDPNFIEAHNNLSVILQELGELKEAEATCKQALGMKPEHAEAHYNLSLTLLHRGRLKEGLAEFEWRWKVAEKLVENRPFPQPLWDGRESLQGKRILLWSEQGIGDTINWASCLPLVASLAEHTILECQEKIVSLLARSFPNIEIRPEEKSNDSKRDDFDFHLPMGSLYRHFIPHIGENSNIDAYLVPDPVRVEFWRDCLGSLGEGPYIGIAWKSSNTSLFRLKHIAPMLNWSSVLTIPDVTFINLQYSDFADDLINIKNDFGVTVHNFDDLDQYNDLDDVAALCAALDVVVSTKITPVILSSGVGTPTKVANWRQSIFNSVLFNPLCSSVEMFHRDTGEPWDKVFESIAGDISKLKK